MIELTSYKGYTVDYRLKEFRRVAQGQLVFIPFASNYGDKLLGEMIEQGLVPQSQLLAMF